MALDRFKADREADRVLPHRSPNIFPSGPNSSDAKNSWFTGGCLSDLLIYGATGYTGQLIARSAVSLGLRPIVAGRDSGRVCNLAAELNCPSRVFSLGSTASVATCLEHVRVVLNCAGPFSHTAVAMIEACLVAKSHYLDITGEINAIEAAARRHEQAAMAGIAIIPAVGFDVVPTDCLAAMLKAALPSATHLKLGFTAARISRGTAKTLLEVLSQGGRVRANGEIRKVPIAGQTLKIPFATGNRLGVSIPWGDVATAYYSTGIPNIEVFAAMPRGAIRRMQQLAWVLPVVKLWPIRKCLQSIIELRIKEPSEQQREWERSLFWGRASNAVGQQVEARLTAPSAYTLTTLTALSAVKRIFSEAVRPGFSTPSQAFGAEFIRSIPDTTVSCGKVVGTEAPNAEAERSKRDV